MLRNTRDLYPDHTQLLEWRDNDGHVHPVRTPKDWEIRRAHIVQGMERLMGPLPAKRVDLDVRIQETAKVDRYTRYKLDYAAEPADRVPAFLLVPDNIEGNAPAMICLHQTVEIGKDEPVGLGGSRNLHYAHELAERGYVCLVPDYPTLGEYKYDFESDDHPSGSIKGIWNHVRGLDLLAERPEVDSKRMGAIGHSLGGHNSIFLAAFDERVAAAVSCCGFTAFCRYYGGNVTGWSGPRYMPRIKEYASCRQLPFDFHELVASLAPRAFMAVAPLRDDNFDNHGVREVMDAAREVYAIHDVADKLVARYPDAAHDFPPADREAAYEFLDMHLRHANDQETK